MPQTDIWIALRNGVEGDGSQQNPYDGSYVETMDPPYRFDNRMRLLFDDVIPYYIHIGRGIYLTQGGFVDANRGWLMNDGWTIAGAGVGATTVQLREFTTVTPEPPTRAYASKFRLEL